MGIVNVIGTNLFKKRLKSLDETISNPHEVQRKVLKHLLVKAKSTAYGKAHNFAQINNLRQFQEQVPVTTYEDLLPYISRLLKGEQGVLWPSKINWLAKSSGTTGANSKFIPVSSEGLHQCHYQGGRDMVALYMRNHSDANLFPGKNLSIGGSQVSGFSGSKSTFYTANISAIVMKNLPFWARLGRTPGLDITLMNNWEDKIRKIAEITTKQNVTSLAGSPMWMLILLQHIMKEQKIKYIQDIWPGLEVFFHGSVSFGPYKPLFDGLDKDNSLRYLEIYNATEGFFGLQDLPNEKSLLLMLNYGIFYEFIPEKDLDKNPKPLSLDQVEKGTKYSMVISTNSGLWRYKIGDTIKFTSTNPYRFVICGRTKNCINVFGEDLFAEHCEQSLGVACKQTGAQLLHFTVAPYFYAEREKGHHEWLIEFTKAPKKLQQFTAILDAELCKFNEDYAEKRKKNIAINRPVVYQMPEGTFYSWLKRKEKLGGQHKIPALSNNREFVEELLLFSRQPNQA